MRLSDVEKLRARRKLSKQEPQKFESFEDFLALIAGGPLLPTMRDFILDDTARAAYMGPAGCAKTTTLAVAGLARALFVPGSKGCVFRADYNDLMKTTMPTFQLALDRLPHGTLIGREKAPPLTWHIKPLVVGANPAEEPPTSEIMFMGLKDHVGSYEWDWVAVDEADECDQIYVDELMTRLRNKPIGGLKPVYRQMIAFNPPDKFHWLYGSCTGRDYKEALTGVPPAFRLFVPRARENAHNLPEDYYKRMDSLPPELRMRLRDGEWGTTFEGQPVFPEFVRSTHANKDLSRVWNNVAPLLRFWDFGYRRPACIWATMDVRGRLLIMRELLGENMEVRELAAHVVQETSRHYYGAREIFDYGDPAVAQHKDTGKALVELASADIHIKFMPSHIDRGLQIVRQRLNTMVYGEPALQVDRTNCPILVQALAGGYRYPKVKGVAELKGGKLLPLKDGFYDHLCDALRYGIVNLYEGRSTEMQSLPQNMPTSVAYNPDFDYGI